MFVAKIKSCYFQHLVFIFMLLLLLLPVLANGLANKKNIFFMFSVDSIHEMVIHNNSHDKHQQQ